MKKRVLAVIIALALVLTTLPGGAFADEPNAASAQATLNGNSIQADSTQSPDEASPSAGATDEASPSATETASPSASATETANPSPSATDTESITPSGQPSRMVMGSMSLQATASSFKVNYKTDNDYLFGVFDFSGDGNGSVQMTYNGNTQIVGAEGSATFTYNNSNHNIQCVAIPDENSKFVEWYFRNDSGISRNYSTNGEDVDVYPVFDLLPAINGISVTNYNNAYDGKEHHFTINGLADGDQVYYSTDNGTTYTSQDVPTLKDAGTKSVKFKVVRSGKQPYYGSGTITISKVQLTVTADPKTVEYGTPLPLTDTVQYSGFISGESQSVLQGTPGFTTTYTATTSAGTSGVTITPNDNNGTFTAANYSFKFMSGTVTVSKAPLTVTADNKSITFGQDPPAYTYSITGFKGNDNQSSVLSGAPSITCSYLKGNGTANYTILAAQGTLSFKNGKGNNYTLQYANGTLSVGNGTLVITPSFKAISYDGKDHAGDIVLTGSQSGDTVTYTVNGHPYSDFKNVQNTNVDVTVSRPNYNTYIGHVNIVINRLELTVNAKDAQTTYGLAAPAFDYTLSGFVTGEDASSAGVTGAPTYTCAYDIGNSSSRGAKTYPIAIASTGSLTSGNYTFKAGSSGTLTVGKAKLTVKADDKSTTYGSAAPAFTYTVTAGYQYGETGGIGGTASYQCAYNISDPANRAAITYAITPVVTGLSAVNYTFEAANGTLTVGKAKLTVKADDKSTTYGLAAPPFTYTITAGYQYGETGGISGAPTYNCIYNILDPIHRGAGTYPITPDVSGMSAANYTFIPATTNGVLTVDKAKLTVKADDKETTYGLAAPAFTYTVTAGYQYGETGGINGAPTYNCIYNTLDPNHRGAGTYPIIPDVTGMSAANYTFIPATTNGVLTVDKATLTVNADNKETTYGLAAPEFTYTIASGYQYGETGGISGAPSFTCAYNITDANHRGAGTYPITLDVTGMNAANYTFNAGANGTLTVDKATLTVTPVVTPSNIKYNDPAPGYTYTIAGYLYNDTISVVSGTGKNQTYCSSSYIKGNPIGNYSVTFPAAGQKLSANNYTFSYETAMLVVGTAPLTGVSVTNNTQTYSGQYYTVNINGTKSGDQILYSSTGLDGSYTSTPIQYKDVTGGSVKVYVEVIRNSNYDPYFGSAYVKIKPATLTVHAQDKSVTYNDPAPNYTSTITGFKGSDTQASVLGANVPTYTCSYLKGSPVGHYDIVPGGLSAQNYIFDYENGTLIVWPATLDVQGENTNVIYDGNKHGITLDNTLSTDSITYTSIQGLFSKTAPEFTDAGTYGVIVTVGRDNYYPTVVTATLTIKQADLTVTADDQTVTYGSAKPAYTATLNFNGEGNTADQSALMSQLKFSCNYVQYSPVGSYPIKVSGISSGNYKVKYNQGTLTVNPAALTITADNKSTTYGAAAPAYTFTVTGGLQGTDTQASVLGGSPDYDCGYATGDNVGPYTITPTVGQLTVKNSNYTLDNATYKTGTLTVGSAKLTITADNKSTTYGAAAPGFTFTVAGLQGEDTQESVLSGAPAYDCGYAPGDKIGGYPIKPSLGEIVLTSSNYTLGDDSFVPGTLTVDPATLTITAEDKNATYGSAVPGFTFKIDGLQGEDTAANVLQGTPAYDCSYVVGNNAGNYTITPSVGQLSVLDTNYKLDEAVSYKTGTLTVDPATLTITAEDKSATYGSAAPGFTFKIDGLQGEDTAANVLQGTPAYDCSYAVGNNAGSYTITPSVGQLSVLDTNYKLDEAVSYKTGTLTVDPAILTITAEDKSAIYGSAAPGFTYKIDGLQGEDTAANVLQGTPAYDCSYAIGNNAGNYTITPSVGQLSVLDTNYKLDEAVSYKTGTLTVDPAPLTVTANDEVVTFGDAVPAYSASYTGFVNGDNPAGLAGTLAFNCGYAQGSAVGTYPITPSGLTSNNYTITFAAGTVTVNAAPITAYRVAFQNYDGTLLKVMWVHKNDAAVAPTNPTRPGYTFTGWSTTFDKVTQNMTITAQFAPVVAAAAPTAAPSAQPTVLPSQSAPAAAPSVSPSAQPSASASQQAIGDNQVPQAAPSAGAQGQSQATGIPFWVWIIIAAGVAAFLIWLFGFKRRKREQH